MTPTADLGGFAVSVATITARTRAAQNQHPSCRCFSIGSFRRGESGLKIEDHQREWPVQPAGPLHHFDSGPDFVHDGGFTEAGRELRERIESLTDELAAPAYDVLSAAELDELIAGLEPISAALTSAEY